MKFTKLSLIAALAVTSAMAGESTITGDAKVFYSTTDANNADLFNKNGGMGDASVSLDYSRGIADGITLNAGITGVSTLGLESTAVSSTWVNHNLEDRFWLDTANITAKIANTTAVIGRQKLDTPLAFTETWNIVENTFDAFTFVNNDIANTSLVASAVTRANGASEFTNFQGGMADLGEAIYAFGAVSEITPTITAQAWYFDPARDNNKKAWLQADAGVADDVTVGVQYAQAMADAGDDSSIIAAKLGYAANGVDLYAAYSQADEDGQVGFANYGGFGGSKVYTEAWWNFGFVTQPGADTIAVGASADLAGLGLSAQYTTVSNDKGADSEMDEITLTASKKVGSVEASLALINTSCDGKFTDAAGVDHPIDGNTVQAYFTVPFSL